MNKTLWDVKVAEYLDLVRDLRSKFGDDHTALTILQEVKKDLRMAQIQQERSTGVIDVDYPATERQRMYLNKLGVVVPERLTKKEASALIDEELGRESE